MPRPANAHSRPRTQIGGTHRRQVLQIAKGLSATLGTDFFGSLVKNLSVTFSVDSVYVAELAGPAYSRLTTLAATRKQQKVRNFEQTLAGTAAEQVAIDGSFACSKDVRLRFPEDGRLQALHAEGYAGVRLCDSTGRPIGLLVVESRLQITDIDLVKTVLETFAPRAAAEIERKRAEDLHRENEERYHAFVSTNPDGMWRFEFEQPIALDLPEEDQLERIFSYGYLAECNEAMARLLGEPNADQMVGYRLGDIFPRTDPQLTEELRTAIRSGFRSTAVRAVARMESGRMVYRLRSQFGIVEDGRLRRLWGTTRDITDLKRAELSLIASERRFREVLEGIQLPAIILDRNGRVTFYNERFLQLAGLSGTELPERRWLNGIIPDEEAANWRAAVQQDREEFTRTMHFEGEIIQRGAASRVVLWDTICLSEEEIGTTAIAAIGRDLSYQRALEAQIRQAQKLESVARLAAGLAHDFNNLLTVILGHAAELLRQDDLGADRSRLKSIEDAAMQCAKMTGQLLAFGRKQELEPRLISLNDVIAGYEGTIRSLIGKSVELETDLASPLSQVYADPAQIQRVLANLVTNARDAMPLGGTVKIATSNVTFQPEDAVPPALKPGAHVRLSVSDSGIGLTEDTRSHLFEPFFTTKAHGKGTGLGLATVYGIVTQSGGHISVHCEPGEPTIFEILLPAAPDGRRRET